MEESIKSFRGNIKKMQGIGTNSFYLDYKDAVEKVILLVSEHKKKDFQASDITEHSTKKEYRENLQKHKDLISDLVYGESFKVKGFDNIEDFIILMANRIAGMDILTELYENKSVSDIHVISSDTIFYEKDGIDIEFPGSFDDDEHYNSFVERISSIAKKQTNKAESKIIDFELFGDRFSIVNNISAVKGHAISIRLHPESHVKRDQLVKSGVVTEEMAEFMDIVIQGEGNTIVGGITGSGKTTTMRALLDYSLGKNSKRVLVCEDTRELYLTNKHTVDFVSIKNNDKNLALTLYEIILATLRLKPKYIVVGEVRGGEAVSAVEAMETGHSTHFSMHGGSTWNILNRLINKYMMGMSSLGIDVVERIIGSAVDYIIIQHNIPGIGRKVTSIDEISYDYENKKFKVTPIFKYDHKEKVTKLVGKMSQEKADSLAFHGVPYERLERWIA